MLPEILPRPSPWLKPGEPASNGCRDQEWGGGADGARCDAAEPDHPDAPGEGRAKVPPRARAPTRWATRRSTRPSASSTRPICPAPSRPGPTRPTPSARALPHRDQARPGCRAGAGGRQPADVLPGQVRWVIRRKIGDVQAVDGISFEVHQGGSLGLVGESAFGEVDDPSARRRLLHADLGFDDVQERRPRSAEGEGDEEEPLHRVVAR